MFHLILLAAAVSAPAEFHRLVDEEWQARLREEPLLATSVGDHRYDDRLPSVAPAELQRAADRRRTTLQRLQAIDRLNPAVDRVRVEAALLRRREPCPARRSIVRRYSLGS